MNKLLTRTLSGIIILILVIFFTTSGGLLLFASVLLLSSVASFEFNRALGRIGINYPLIWQLISGFVISYFAFMRYYELLILFIAGLTVFSFIIAALGNKYDLRDMNGFIFSVLYINLLLSIMLIFDNSEYLYLVYCCAWGTDTFAYVFGILLGRHKLIERLSPNKTIEGAIGGIFGSVVLVLIVVFLREMERPFMWALFAAIGSMISQMGDISASAIKRKAGIKDYGNIIIGHGGILDRFDSVLFTLPVVYLLSLVLGR